MKVYRCSTEQFILTSSKSWSIDIARIKIQGKGFFIELLLEAFNLGFGCNTSND